MLLVRVALTAVAEERVRPVAAPAEDRTWDREEPAPACESEW